MTDNEPDPMDQRLREYGERWRDQQPRPEGVDVERLTSAPSSGRSWWLAAGVAAVFAGVVVAAQLIDPPDTPQAPQTPQAPKTQEAVQPGNVVPWAPLDATHPHIPTTTIPEVPDPALAAQAPLCRVSDVRAESEPDGAGGTLYLFVRLVLTADRPCRVDGYPDIQPLDNGQLVDIPLRHVRDRANYKHPVLVADGQPAVFALNWGQWCTTLVLNDTIRLLLPGGGVNFSGFGSSPYCNAFPGSGPPPIFIQPFEPENHHPAHNRSIYANLNVDGELDVAASPGQTVPFTVTMTSRQRLVLDPCPDYTISQSGPGVSQKERYALNCAGVPYRDAENRPYLPAATPVRFAMQTTAGGHGAYKFMWELNLSNRFTSLIGELAVESSTGPQTPATGQEPAVGDSVRGETQPISCQDLIDEDWRAPGTTPDFNYDPESGILDVSFGADAVLHLTSVGDSACASVPDIGTMIGRVLDDYELSRAQECAQAVSDVNNGVVPRKGKIVSDTDSLRAHVLAWCPTSFGAELSPPTPQ